MRPLPLVPALVLCSALLAGCSGDSSNGLNDVALEASDPAADSASASPSSSAGAGAAPSASAGDSSTEGSTAGAPAGTSAGTTPSSAPADSAGPAPRPSSGGAVAGAPAGSAASPSSAAAAPARSAAPAGPALATRAGSYTYDSKGTVTLGAGAPQSRSGSATLTVDPPEGDRQSGVLEGEQGRTETDSVLRKDGRYLARLLLTTPAFSKEFRPASPVLLLPEPLTAGRTWSFTLKSTDGKTTATAKSRVLRSEAVTIGGTRVDTRVVETVLALRGDVVYDGTTTSNHSPKHRLAVKERGQGKGSVNSVPFSSDTTSTLRSVEPS